MSGITRYLEVTVEIPQAVEDAVRAALRYAMRELGIKRTVRYGFFVPGSERMAAEWPCRTFIAVGQIAGAVRVIEPDHIWIRAGLSPLEACRVALHEMVHVKELENADGGLADGWERIATAFADAHLRHVAR